MLGIPTGIKSSTIGLEICAIVVGIKRNKSIIKKKKKKYDKIALLAKSKLNSIEIVIFKTVVNSSISHDEFVLTSNVLKEYDDMKEDWKRKLKT